MTVHFSSILGTCHICRHSASLTFPSHIHVKNLSFTVMILLHCVLRATTKHILQFRSHCTKSGIYTGIKHTIILYTIYSIKLYSHTSKKCYTYAATACIVIVYMYTVLCAVLYAYKNTPALQRHSRCSSLFGVSLGTSWILPSTALHASERQRRLQYILPKLTSHYSENKTTHFTYVTWYVVHAMVRNAQYSLVIPVICYVHALCTASE